jgi:hypothetical protein
LLGFFKMKVAPSQAAKQAPAKAAKSACDAKKEGGAQEIILGLLAESAGVGDESLPRDRLVQGTGLSPKTVTNNLPKLKAMGLVEYDAKTVRLTPRGIESTGAMENAPKTNADIHERIKGGLKGKPLELFELMQDGGRHDRDWLAQQLGYDDKTTKAFVNAIGKLSGQGLVQYPDPSSAQLADHLFRFGRD